MKQTMPGLLWAIVFAVVISGCSRSAELDAAGESDAAGEVTSDLYVSEDLLVTADISSYEIQCSLLVVTEELPLARVAIPYEESLEIEGASGEVHFSLADGLLPPGLDLAETGIIFGKPAASGSYLFSVLVQDDCSEELAELQIDVPPVVLMSGFEPFGGYETNPSIEALWPLDQQLISGLDIRVVELPVVWDVSWQLLAAEIDLLAPEVVIATGVAGTDAMRYEVVAVNEQWGTDNDGEERFGEPVVEEGPPTLETGLPVKEMAGAVEEAGHDTTISDDAGTYLCNHIFYHVMYHAGFRAEGPLVAGFIHVPPAEPGQAFTVHDITLAHMAGLRELADWLESGRRGTSPEADTHTSPFYLGVSAATFD